MNLPANDPRQLYIELLKRCLLGMVYEDPPDLAPRVGGYVTHQYLPKLREFGRDLPGQAHSMIGLRRMNNLQACIEQALAEDVPGDLIETGVWRGGATIFMRGVLKAHDIRDRRVWVADSFAGLPVPDVEAYPPDAVWTASTGKLAVDFETVRRNFERYGLLDEQVSFLPGWFKDTLPQAPIVQLAVLRMDGDYYQSTWEVFTCLYSKVAPGGFIIIDDYNHPTCRQAVHDYRAAHNITEAIEAIDGFGVFWRKTRP